MTHTVATVMVGNGVLYDICHHDLDDGSALDRNRRIHHIFGDCARISMTDMHAVGVFGEVIQFGGLGRRVRRVVLAMFFQNV